MQIAGIVIALSFIVMIVISPSNADFDPEDCYFDFEGETDSDALTTHYTTNWKVKLIDILKYLIYGYEDEPVLKSYKCTRTSPVSPSWTPTSPNVFWSHIFCGQICRGGNAQGFHSMTTDSDHNMCIYLDLFKCYPQPDGNDWCDFGSVDVWNDNTGNWVQKTGETSLFNQHKSVATIINALVRIYNACAPPANSTALCALGCNYAGNSRKFDIKIILVPRGTSLGILTAYPVPGGQCTTGHVCSGKCGPL